MPDLATSPDEPPERWVTRSYGCTFLSCSASYLDNLIRSGALPSFKIGTRSIRLRLSDLQAIVQPVAQRESA